MAAPKTPRKATFADLVALGDNVRAEIIHGVVVEKAMPTFEHGESQTKVAAFFDRRFARKPGGRWPGGWWIGTEVDVEYESHEVYRHDAVGWRRDRVPVRPSGRPVKIRPDWVCELLSPSNEKHDRVDKFQVLHVAGVPHYWLGNPQDKTLIVHRWTERGYLIVLTAKSGDTVRAEPFEAIDLRVGVLFGDEEDEE
jgi:Uma2 family endonuclease